MEHVYIRVVQVVLRNTDYTLTHTLTKLEIKEHHRMITYDIKDLYVNIPIEETLTRTKQQLLEDSDIHKTEQIITCLRTILNQNYFEFQNNIYHPKNGVAMGSPISGAIAEIMLQHIENQHIKHLIETGNIIYYTRYVDDIFIVYDSTKTTTEEIQSYADHIHKNLKFTITQENNKQINFLDILITRREQKLDINIYRKRTTTDTTINYLSNHPTEREIAAYRYYINRMNKLPLNEKNRTIEWQTILKIAHNNNFPANKI